jgi:hypothetical protein
MAAVYVSVACRVLAFLTINFKSFFLVWFRLFFLATRTVLEILGFSQCSAQVELITFFYFNRLQVKLTKLDPKTLGIGLDIDRLLPS